MALDSHTTPRKTRLLETIRQYAIGSNPEPAALYSFAISLITIWCVPADHPGGIWDRYPWRASPSSQLAKAATQPLSKSMLLYSEAAQDIVGFTLQTKAYGLMSKGLVPRDAIENRPEDLAWATRKLVWLWAEAFPAEPPPEIKIEWDRDRPKEDFSDIF